MTTEIDIMNAQQMAVLENKLDMMSAQTAKEIDRILVVHSEMDGRLRDLQVELHNMIQANKESEAALETLKTVVHGSVVLKWIVVSVVFIFSAVSIFSTGIEVMRGWTK